MAHLTPNESIKLLNEMRNGEEVICPKCNKGIMRTPYNPKTAMFFQCDACGSKWHLCR